MLTDKQRREKTIEILDGLTPEIINEFSDDIMGKIFEYGKKLEQNAAIFGFLSLVSMKTMSLTLTCLNEDGHKEYLEGLIKQAKEHYKSLVNNGFN